MSWFGKRSSGVVRVRSERDPRAGDKHDGERHHAGGGGSPQLAPRSEARGHASLPWMYARTVRSSGARGAARSSVPGGHADDRAVLVLEHDDRAVMQRRSLDAPRSHGLQASHPARRWRWRYRRVAADPSCQPAHPLLPGSTRSSVSGMVTTMLSRRQCHSAMPEVLPRSVRPYLLLISRTSRRAWATTGFRNGSRGRCRA
jgi:hypothetical protein